MFIFTSIWFLFTIVTYGVWVPSGLFLPGMIIGCGVGSFYGTLISKWELHSSTDYSPVTPVLVSAGAMLAGYTRLTYSLVIIMLETTSSIDIFIPMMVGIMASRAVSGLLTRSLYERALRTKQIPLL